MEQARTALWKPKNPPNSGTFFAAGNANPVDTYSDLGIAPGYNRDGPRTMSLLDEDSPRLTGGVGPGQPPHGTTMDLININDWRGENQQQQQQQLQQLPNGKKGFWHPFPEIVAGDGGGGGKQLTVVKVQKADSDARYSDSVYGDKGCGSPCFIASFAIVGALLAAAVIGVVVMIKLT